MFLIMSGLMFAVCAARDSCSIMPYLITCAVILVNVHLPVASVTKRLPRLVPEIPMKWYTIMYFHTYVVSVECSLSCVDILPSTQYESTKTVDLMRAQNVERGSRWHFHWKCITDVRILMTFRTCVQNARDSSRSCTIWRDTSTPFTSVLSHGIAACVIRDLQYRRIFVLTCGCIQERGHLFVLCAACVLHIQALSSHIWQHTVTVRWCLHSQSSSCM